MSTFWNLSDNTDATNTGGEFETGGGDIQPIPSNTSVLAAIDEAKIDDYQGEEYISLRWTILQPEEYKNRKIFQKVRVWDADPRKSDKAKRMLAAIDTNAGGKLMASGEEPSDLNLTIALVNKPMVIKLQVWEIEKDDGSKASGNWVCAVSPRNHQSKSQPQQKASVKKEGQQQVVGGGTNDDIPF